MNMTLVHGMVLRYEYDTGTCYDTELLILLWYMWDMNMILVHIMVLRFEFGTVVHIIDMSKAI